MALKRKNVTLNIRRIKITSRCKNMSYLWKQNLKKGLSKSINYRKVRNHCHYAAKYRGAVHSQGFQLGFQW